MPKHVFLAVDLGERHGADGIFDVAHRERRSVSRIVPSAEGEQQRRIAQRRTDVQTQLAHRGQGRTFADRGQAWIDVDRAISPAGSHGRARRRCGGGAMDRVRCTGATGR